MGILTLLRNAFGRGRKGRTPEAEGADTTPRAEVTTTPEARTDHPQVPEPRQSEDSEHELVSAAFDNVSVPKQAEGEPTTPEPTVSEPTAKAEPVAPEPVAKAEPTIEAEPVAEREPVAEAEPEPEPVTEAEPEPVADEKAEPVIEAEPEPVAEEKPEPVIEAEPVAEPEPAAQADPEPVSEPESAAEAEPVAAEPEPVLEAKAEPELVAEAEPTPVAEAEPEPVAVVEPEPEPVVEAEAAEPAAEPVIDEPAAADGEEAPQGPPAPDNESRTGGAGGNDAAEGEAETEEPQPTAVAPQPTAVDPQQTPAAASTPATTLARLKTRAPGLATAYRAAASALKQNDLSGTRAKTYLVLDRSASMRPYYKDGSAQALAEQTLALAAHLDDDATVHVTFFSTELDGTTELTLTDHENKIDDTHATLGRMGRTSYHVAVEEVVTQHHKNTPAGTPALVIFQTDGAPDAKTPATQALTDAAKNHPGIHFAFVAFGEHDNKAFDYLRKLKTDNTSFFHAGPTPRELTDTELYTGVLENWRP